MQRLFSQLWPTPSRSSLRRETPRWWVLVLVLPLLWMSVLSQTPHSHQTRVLERGLQTTAHHDEAAIQNVAPSTSDSGAHSPQLLALHAETSLEIPCLLCQWANIAGAWLVVALALLLGALVLRDLPHARVSSFSLLSAPLSLRSRAPPL